MKASEFLGWKDPLFWMLWAFTIAVIVVVGCGCYELVQVTFG